jgi:hypothetical protein
LATVKFPVKSKDAIFEAPVTANIPVVIEGVDIVDVATIDVEVRPDIVVVAKDVLPVAINPAVVMFWTAKDVADIDVQYKSFMID